MSVRVLVFAGAREAIGAGELAIEIASEPPMLARAFLDRLCGEHPRLTPFASSLRLAINGTYAAWTDEIRDGDEVAIIPPVAGG